MPLDKTVEQLTQALALWLIPGSNQRRVVKSYLATTGLPNLSFHSSVSALANTW